MSINQYPGSPSGDEYLTDGNRSRLNVNDSETVFMLRQILNQLTAIRVGTEELVGEDLLDDAKSENT